MPIQTTNNNSQTTSPKIVIAGGTGLIGTGLVPEFTAAGYEVVVLSRSGRQVPGARSLQWDAKTLSGWPAELEGAAAVINLTGEPIAERWTDENRRKIVESRVESTRVIGDAIAQSIRPPNVWINGSAVGYYGDTGDRETDENGPPGQGFMAEVCVKWEAAMQTADTPHTRQVRMRTGVVLAREGGVLAILKKLGKSFIGGAAGNGRQYVPWIHVEDTTRLFRWCVETDISGPVNCVSPHPARNAELMAALRKALGRPWAPPAPKPMLTLASAVIGMPASAILESSRIIPAAALKRGFEFNHPDLEQTMKELLST